MTAIEWTNDVWNPIRGCSLVSSGYANYYAMKQAHRFSGAGQPYEGLTEIGPHGPRWSGAVRLVPEALDIPLKWKKPRRIFVNSMSDLFHEAVPDEFILQVFTVMGIANQHTFQVLTKRPRRMQELLSKWTAEDIYMSWHSFRGDSPEVHSWPLPNVHLGVSIEDQPTADERIQILLQTPAAVRWVSAEPLLGPVDLSGNLGESTKRHFRIDVEGMLRNRSFHCLQHDDGRPMTKREAEDELFALHAKGVKFIPASQSCVGFDPEDGCPGHANPRLDWVVVGGESGPSARPCDLAWIRSIVQQCKAAGVPCFVKQLGARIFDRNDAEFDGCSSQAWPDGTETDRWDLDPARQYQGAATEILIKDRKGGDPAEWPEDLRMREWPMEERKR